MKQLSNQLIEAICEAVEFADQAAGEGLRLRKSLLTIYDRLSRISALETPKGSAASKKMARIARGEG